MTDRFKVGDRVRIIRGDRVLCDYEATIETQSYVHSRYAEYGQMYDIEVREHEPSSAASGLWASPEHWLAPLYDGYEKTTWDQCVWRPKVLEKV